MAFVLLLCDRIRGGKDLLPPSVGVITPDECTLLAVVAHWRGHSRRRVDDEEPLLECVAGLIAMPARQVEIVVITDAVEEAVALLQSTFGTAGDETLDVRAGAWSWPSGASRSILVEGFAPRWPH